MVNFELTVLRAPLTDFDNFKTTNTFNVSIFTSFFCGVHSATVTLLLRDPEAPRIGISLYQNITILSFYKQYTSIKVDQKMYFHAKYKYLFSLGFTLLPSRVSSAIT